MQKMQQRKHHHLHTSTTEEFTMPVEFAPIVLTSLHDDEGLGRQPDMWRPERIGKLAPW